MESLQTIKIPSSTYFLEVAGNEAETPQNEENKHTSSVGMNPEGEIVSKEKPELTFQQKKRLAYWVGIHLCVLRHFLGGNAIISQGGVFITYFNSRLGYYTPIIINSVMFVFVVANVIWIQKAFGKRQLFLFSMPCLCVINIAVAIAMIF